MTFVKVFQLSQPLQTLSTFAISSYLIQNNVVAEPSFINNVQIPPRPFHHNFIVFTKYYILLDLIVNRTNYSLELTTIITIRNKHPITPRLHLKDNKMPHFLQVRTYWSNFSNLYDLERYKKNLKMHKLFFLGVCVY